MLTKFIITILAVFSVSVMGFTPAAADDQTPACSRLDEKASGDMAKYSLSAEVNGPFFFSGIGCAIKHRNKEFCAMEMVYFDSTAKVYDYYTDEEIEIENAYFWLDEKNNETPIVAFGSTEAAEKYGSETGRGTILDYTGLTDRKFK